MKQPHDWREWRRLRALSLFRHGWKECDIAEALGASKGAVSQWLATARVGGRKALYSQPHGTHAKLTDDQRRLIPDFRSRSRRTVRTTTQPWVQCPGHSERSHYLVLIEAVSPWLVQDVLDGYLPAYFPVLANLAYG